jgi:hypothetical protein
VKILIFSLILLVGAVPLSGQVATVSPCAAGYYMNGSGVCSIAPAGSYSAGGTSTSSTPCPPGSYQPDAGQASCHFALAGSYAAGPGALSATPCLSGTYQPAAGQTSCLDAPAGSFATGPGATASAQCPIGTTTNAPGSTACVRIPPLVAYDALINAAHTTAGVAAPEATKLVNGRTQLVAAKVSQACKAVDSFLAYVTSESGRRISAANASTLLYKSREAKIAMGC